jgi:spore maturation protein A
MLNSIWAGLIILSIVFAGGQDVRDEFTHRHANDTPQTLSYTTAADDSHIILHVEGLDIAARLHDSELSFSTAQPLPERWQRIAQHHDIPANLRARIVSQDASQHQLSLILPSIHWMKTKAVLKATFDMAEFAIKLAIGLAGVMALWLGLMQIAEHSGLIQIIVRALYPLLRKLFPDVPADHPAMGSISLNIAANMLGLGNAATPMGIKAMQQLQELNKKKDEASDAMCMFLAINTSSVQLLPPVTLIALLGAQVSELLPAILLATICSTAAAIITAKLYARRSRA